MAVRECKARSTSSTGPRVPTSTKLTGPFPMSKARAKRLTYAQRLWANSHAALAVMQMIAIDRAAQQSRSLCRARRQLPLSDYLRSGLHAALHCLREHAEVLRERGPS